MPLVVSHLSFYAQDGRLDKSLLLDRYKKLINEYGNMLSIKINLIKDHTDYLNIIPMLGISGENIHEQSHSLLSYTNTGLRLWQNPKQLASLSKFMEDKHILSYLEIGALHGGTFIYLSEFFSKKNNDIKLYACDIKPMSDLLKDYSKIRKFAYYQKSSQSADFKQTINRIKPEFVLIDGDHSYDNAKKDFLLFENLKNTKYILLHDIVNDACPDIKKLWTELKNNNKFDHHEFTEQYNDTPGGGKYFGFGLLVRKL
jgi:cephalosporin hydroxylase